MAELLVFAGAAALSAVAVVGWLLVRSRAWIYRRTLTPNR